MVYSNFGVCQKVSIYVKKLFTRKIVTDGYYVGITVVTT
jgi:hypothetical protein